MHIIFIILFSLYCIIAPFIIFRFPVIRESFMVQGKGVALFGIEAPRNVLLEFSRAFAGHSEDHRREDKPPGNRADWTPLASLHR